MIPYLIDFYTDCFNKYYEDGLPYHYDFAFNSFIHKLDNMTSKDMLKILENYPILLKLCNKQQYSLPIFLNYGYLYLYEHEITMLLRKEKLKKLRQ